MQGRQHSVCWYYLQRVFLNMMCIYLINLCTFNLYINQCIRKRRLSNVRTRLCDHEEVRLARLVLRSHRHCAQMEGEKASQTHCGASRGNGAGKCAFGTFCSFVVRGAALLCSVSVSFCALLCFSLSLLSLHFHFILITKMIKIRSP